MGDSFKKNNLFNKVSKSFFNKNDKNSKKKNKKNKSSDAYKQVNNIQTNKKVQTQQYNVNQQHQSNRVQASSEMEIILNNRLLEVQRVLIGLVGDVQKSNPSFNEIAELITSLWKIGNKAKEYQENNELSTLNDILSNQEKILLDNIDEIQIKIDEASVVDSRAINSDISDETDVENIQAEIDEASVVDRTAIDQDTSDETESDVQVDESIIIDEDEIIIDNDDETIEPEVESSADIIEQETADLDSSDDIQIEEFTQKIDELKNQLEEIKKAKKIVKDSLRPIDSIVRQYEVILVKLSKYGFEIRDLTGDTYSVNKNINVKAFEHDPNIKNDIISETVKPEIYYKDQKILKAEVYVTLADDE